MSKTYGYARIIRPVNCIMMGVAVIVGAALASFESFLRFWPNLVYGFITGFVLTGASMAINDYYDQKIDAINEPGRPIPSGLIRSKEALAFASILTGIGFLCAFLTSVLCLLAAILAWTVFVIYTTVGKQSGLPGNLLVSACVAVPFIYGSITIIGVVRLSVLLFASMAFLSNTGREITKGIVDVQGDRKGGIRTLAVSFGVKIASLVATVFYVSAVLLSPIPWLLHIVSFWFIPLVIVTDFGLSASSLMLLKDHSREKARKIKNTILLWFIFGLMAFAVGVLT